jgi:hypothetical protein
MVTYVVIMVSCNMLTGLGRYVIFLQGIYSYEDRPLEIRKIETWTFINRFLGVIECLLSLLCPLQFTTRIIVSSDVRVS